MNAEVIGRQRQGHPTCCRRSAPAVLAIFAPLRQRDLPRAQPSGGVGLGRYLVRQLVDALGGRIEVERRVGTGSTFSLWSSQHRTAHGLAAAAREDQS